MSLEIDWETRGARDLVAEGAYRYAEHRHTDALMASYKINRGPLRRWRRGQPCPADIRAHVEAGGEIKAFNAAFERLIWWLIMSPRYGWPKPKLEQFRCTAVTAAALSLPRSLDRLGVALDLKQKKGKEGRALIKLHSMPQGFTPDGEPIWNEDPISLEKFHDYCDSDVLAEEEADDRMIPLSDYEQRVYWLNERINDRGIRLDVKSARAAVRMIVLAKEGINAEIAELTGKAVTACTQTAAMKRWIEAQGVFMPSMDKDDVEEFLHATDLPDRVKRVLELRQEGAKPSVEKIAAMLQRTCDDGRIRGVYLDHGAGQTGRFSSRGAQLHNMPKYRKIFENSKVNLELLFQHIRSGDPRMVELMYGPELGRPLHLLSDAVRGFLWAAPGYEFIDIDYSSIESVLGAYIVGEEWKLDAYRALNRGEGTGMYELAAAAIYGIPVEQVTKLHRPVGKLSELSCFAADTQILTSNGVKCITEVSLQDRLWDGVEWVAHDGVIARGAKPVVDVDGIGVTPDHLLLSGRSWRSAQELASSERTLSRALATGSENLPSSASSSALPAACATSLSDAIAAVRNTTPFSAICWPAGKPAAENAGRKSLATIARNISDTMTLSPMTSTGGACLAESPPVSIAAATRKTKGTRTTADAALRSSSLGARAAATFSRTSSRWTAGIGRILNSIARTSTATTSPATCGSSRAPSTRATDARHKIFSAESPSCKPKSTACVPVFDILNAGPRHRFTIFSRSGALIAHNCQYQTGVGGIRKFARQNKVQLPPLFSTLWKSASEETQEGVAKRFEERVKAHDPNTDALGREGWIAAELIKLGWRAKNPAFVAGWKLLEDAATGAVSEPGAIYEALGAKYRVAHGFLWCLLPSGRALAYGRPKIEDVVAPWADMTLEPAKRERKRGITVVGVDAVTEKWVRRPIYGGALFNNYTQGGARDILVHGMFNVEAHGGYPIVLHTHDEMAAEVPRGYGSIEEMAALANDLPAWCRDLPLKASGWRGKRYRKD
jgi:hypothetical protein